MSVCYSLVCDDCSETIWIGQAPAWDRSAFYLYTDDEAVMKLLPCFLIAHLNHSLRFVTEQDDSQDTYKEFEKEWDDVVPYL